jgi:hypothetical protein
MENVILNNIKINILTWNNIKIVRELYNMFNNISYLNKCLDYTNIDNFIEKNEKELYIIQHTIMLFMAKFMDLYTLSKMFSKNKKNIVCYTGRTHTMTYLRFLVSIEFEKIYEWHSKNNYLTDNIDHFSFDRSIRC